MRRLLSDPVGVVGLDLSLRAAAGCYLPPRWDPASPKQGVVFDAWGYEIKVPTERQQWERIESIALGVLEFVDRRRAKDGPDVRVFVEGYAFAKNMTSATKLRELGGAVKYLLFDRLNAVVEPVVIQQGRSLFLGRKMRSAEQVVAVHSSLRRLGFEFDESDPGDALVVANAGRHVLGLPCMTNAG